uniref:TetR-like C-terminal domain-containing protein n=1 Tax=Eubacterium sp. TaxID=142586 RepID=UPI003FEEA4B4
MVNVYNCVDKAQVEKYLKPLTDDLFLGVVEDESVNIRVRDEDKKFIAKIYSYCFVGIMLYFGLLC